MSQHFETPKVFAVSLNRRKKGKPGFEIRYHHGLTTTAVDRTDDAAIDQGFEQDEEQWREAARCHARDMNAVFVDNT